MNKTITKLIAVATLAFGGGLGIGLSDFGGDHTSTPEWSDGYMNGYYHGADDESRGIDAPSWLEDLRMD